MDLHFIERNLVNIILKIKQIFLEEKNLNSKLDIKEKSHQDYVTNFDIKIQKYFLQIFSLSSLISLIQKKSKHTRDQAQLIFP